MHAIDSPPLPLAKTGVTEKGAIYNGPNNTIQTNKHGPYRKKNDNHNILQSKQLYIPSTKYATWAVEMQSFLSYPNPSLSLLPIHDGDINKHHKRQCNVMRQQKIKRKYISYYIQQQHAPPFQVTVTPLKGKPKQTSAFFLHIHIMQNKNNTVMD